MKQRTNKKVSAKLVRQLLEDSAHRVDPELSKELMGRVYALEDGRALLVEYDGKGILWYSHSELTSRYRASVKRAMERRDPLTEILPHPERFRTDVAALVHELPRALGIDGELLDFTEKSLDAVDKTIRRLGSERVLTPEVFPPLVAYIGEVIRRQVRGAWELRSTREGSRLEPEIVEVTGGRHQLLRIYKELLEYGRAASMRAFVDVALRKYRMLPRH